MSESGRSYLSIQKLNDYFEFPRNLDMEPYTVGGLAKIEGEAIDCDPSDLDSSQIRKYRYVLKYQVNFIK